MTARGRRLALRVSIAPLCRALLGGARSSDVAAMLEEHREEVSAVGATPFVGSSKGRLCSLHVVPLETRRGDVVGVSRRSLRPVGANGPASLRGRGPARTGRLGCSTSRYWTV